MRGSGTNRKANNLRKKYIIFDFDGTLFDSNGIILDSWQAVFRHYTGAPGDEREIYRSFGETIRYTSHRFFPNEDVDETVALYRKYQEENYAGKIGLFDGIPELLDQLKDSGRSLSIVTSRTRKTSLEYIDSLDIRKYFDVLVTCDDTDAHKPDPKPLLIALDELGADKSESIMLGDTKFDIGCGNNAGVECALVGWSHDIDEAEMKSLGFRPDYRLQKPVDLLPLI